MLFNQRARGVRRRAGNARLLRQGVWTGDEAGSFAAARAQSLAEDPPADAAGAPPPPADGAGAPGPPADAAGAPPPPADGAGAAGPPAGAPEPAAGAAGPPADAAGAAEPPADGAGAPAAAAADASPAAAGKATGDGEGDAGGADWSYFAATPLDLSHGGALGWALGGSNSSDPKMLDGPALLHTPPCRHRLSRAWWAGCADAQALRLQCEEAGAGSELWEKEGCGTGLLEPAQADKFTAEWWASDAGAKAWAECQKGGFGSPAWNANKCWRRRCGAQRRTTAGEGNGRRGDEKGGAEGSRTRGGGVRRQAVSSGCRPLRPCPAATDPPCYRHAPTTVVPEETVSQQSRGGAEGQT